VLTTLTSFFFFFGSMAQVVHTQESNKNLVSAEHDEHSARKDGQF